MKMLNVINIDGQLVVDSREVAEMVDKRHADLMRDIKNYCDILLNANLRSMDFFLESTYKDSIGRTLPCYLLTKKGCDMVANKMTGEKGVIFTAAYVDRFYEMEALLKEQQAPYKIPQTYSEALRLAADLQEQIEHDKPKVQFVDKFVTSDNLLCLRDVLKNLGVRERSTIAFLIDKKVLYRGKGGLRPMAEYQHKGYFEVKTATFNEKNVVRTLVTPAGHTWLASYLRKHHLIP